MEHSHSDQVLQLAEMYQRAEVVDEIRPIADNSVEVRREGGVSLIQLTTYPAPIGEMVIVLSGLRAVPVSSETYDLLCRYSASMDFGSFFLATSGESEIGLAIFKTAVPHELLLSSATESLQDYGHSAMRNAFEAPRTFEQPDSPFSMVPLGGRSFGSSEEDTGYVLLMCA